MAETGRIGDGKVRSHFRTREGTGEERLPTRVCEECGQGQYQVLEGGWLHWDSLGVQCALDGVSEGQEEGKGV